MYVTAGLFSILLKQFEDVEVNVPKIFSTFKTDLKTLASPLSRIDAGILGQYFEKIVARKNNHRIGLETGFMLPFMVTGSIFNICRNYTTARELFAAPFDFTHLTENDIHKLTTKEDRNFFYFELTVDQEFTSMYPVAARQWIEMQYGIALQYAYSFSGRYVYPVAVHSLYPQEGEYDRLMEYFGCPVKFEQNKFAIVFNKAVLNLPITTPNSGLLPMFEDYMNEIQILEEQQNKWSSSVRRYLRHSLSASNLSLDLVAERFNMSKRNFHRKLKAEGTSYQQVLDNVRVELSRKYLKEKIPLREIAFLLGFESQSAFNKFFHKHFHTTPSQFR